MWKSPATELPEPYVRVVAMYQSLSSLKSIVVIGWIKPCQGSGYGKTQWAIVDGVKGMICVPATTILWWCEIPKLP